MGTGRHPPCPGAIAPIAAGSQGVLEVAEHSGLLRGRGLWEAGVVHVADETLEPRDGAGRGQRLVGEVACGDAGMGSFARISTVFTPRSTLTRTFIGCPVCADAHWGPCG